ncbi:MAG: hypothetical protein SF051_05110 [Elusimicrobiota bacterium]|nr:hypothetical protein [Elusimicrobiota bacterium]
MSRDWRGAWWQAVNEGGDPRRFSCRSDWFALEALGGAMCRLWRLDPAGLVRLLEERGGRDDGPEGAVARGEAEVVVRHGGLEERFAPAEFETLAAEFGVMLFDELAAMDAPDALWELLPRLQALKKRGQDAGGPKVLPETRYDPRPLVLAPGRWRAEVKAGPGGLEVACRADLPGLGLLGDEVGYWWGRDPAALVAFLEGRGALAREYGSMDYPEEPWRLGVKVTRGPLPSDWVTVPVADFEVLAAQFALMALASSEGAGLADDARRALKPRLEAVRERGWAAGGTRSLPTEG